MTKVTRLTLDEEGGLQNRRIHLREISGDVDAPLETVGQDLRAARLRRGDDLATVSRALKIRKDHLEALEEDRLEALPGRTYAIGFVRSYADYLGLDAVQSVERFKAEIAGRSDHVTPVQVIEEDEHRRLPQGWIIIAVVVIAALAYGAYRLAVSADQMLAQPVTPPPPQVAVAKPVVVAKVEKKPAPASPGTIAANGTPAPAVSLAPAGEQPNANPTAVSPPPASTSGLMPSGEAPPAQQQTAALPPGEVYGGQNKNSRVTLRVHSATKILVTDQSGRIFINRTLKPGDTYQVPNLVGLSLMTPDGGAVEIDLDGSAMGFAGRNQEVKESVPLDPQAIVDRYNGGRG
jgi:cytoskeleton protein RodZ